MPTAPTHPTVASLLRRGDLSLRFLDTVDEEQLARENQLLKDDFDRRAWRIRVTDP